ncbi:MAG: hypothetical protein ACTSQK_10080 [Candidatus Heimdallarchaeota archaeon]
MNSEDSEKREDMAHYWAPIWYQDTDEDGYEGDYITNFNYDGDWVGNNNWNNLYSYPLRAYIYYSVIETPSHYFLGYYDFHPRDWHDYNDFDKHENDMEGVLIVIKKNSGWGDFLCMVTEAHNDFRQYTDYDNSPSSNVEEGYEDIDGDVQFKSAGSYDVDTTFEVHNHPIVYVDCEGHGVYGARRWESNGFPGGDGIIYYPKGNAEEPSGKNDRDVSYALTSIDVLWKKRFDSYGSGHTFGSFYEFDGNDYGTDKAKAPWGWDDGDDGPTFTGEIFYNPMDLIRIHFDGLGTFYSRYTWNPYVVKVRLENYIVEWDKDGSNDLSDGYLNLYMFDGEGRHTPGDGVLDGDSGSQYSWIKENTKDEWLDMRDEIPRGFYGIRYPGRPFFGLRSRDWDEYSTDDWLMGREKTHWYGYPSISSYDGSIVDDIDICFNHIVWTGSQLKLTLEGEADDDGYRIHRVRSFDVTNPSASDKFGSETINIQWTPAIDNFGHEVKYIVSYARNHFPIPIVSELTFSPSTTLCEYSWDTSTIRTSPSAECTIIILAYCDCSCDEKTSLASSEEFTVSCNIGTYILSIRISSMFFFNLFLITIVRIRTKYKQRLRR